MKFTKEQLKHYAAFEKVKTSAEYNMFSSSARQAAGLTEKEYRFVMENYSALKDAAMQENSISKAL